MKIAYLVFAYKNPQLLQRVFNRLSTPDSAFFVHIDQKSDIEQFRSIRGNNIFFSEKRIPVYWAEFTGIEAILLLMRQALASAGNYDFFVLLSGSDYPLRSADYIHTFLQQNRGAEFISIVKVPAPGKPLSRINTLRLPSTKPLRRFIVRAMAKLGMAQRDYRNYLGSMDAYSGNTWWTLSREACQYIVDFVKSHNKIVDFFQNVFAPEESFFHTILGNSEFREKCRRNLLYEDWSAQGAHPEIISEEHCRFFETHEQVSIDDGFGQAELLFARKFSDQTLAQLDRMDQMIEQKERSSLVSRN